MIKEKETLSVLANTSTFDAKVAIEVPEPV
jgi:hypothetical protein